MPHYMNVSLSKKKKKMYKKVTPHAKSYVVYQHSKKLTPQQKIRIWVMFVIAYIRHLGHVARDTFDELFIDKSKSSPKKKAVSKAFQKRESDMQLILLPLILLFCLFAITSINNDIYRSNAAEELPATTVQTQINPYPYVESTQAPEITADAGIILDRKSQVVLFKKNEDVRLSMASTTKIMTALTALDYYKADDILTVKNGNVEGSGVGLVVGDKFSFNDLFYMMMLPSANDAAQTIADNYPGGSDAFIKSMNEKAKSLSLNDTHFSDPTGLNDDGDYTTAIDLARLASHAIANPYFVEVTSTRYHVATSIGYGGQYELTNLNILLGDGGVTGIKTGTTEGAGQVLVTSTIKDGHTYIIVVMHSDDRFTDTRLLLNFIDQRVEYIYPAFEYTK